MHPIDAQHKVLLLDNSAIEAITTCPRRSLYSILQRRRRAIPAPALRFGGHLHAALAYRYRCEAIGLPWKEDTQMRILDRRFTTTPCENEGWRNLGTAQKVIQQYNLHWSFDTTAIIKDKNGFPLVEKPFAVNAGSINGWTILYIGRIDLAFRKDSSLFIRDHKTSSIMGDSYWNDAAVSEQQRGYCWALSRILDEEPVGYEINVLVTRAPTKTGCSIDFQRRTFYTKGQLDEWHNNMLQQAEYFLWCYERESWPMHHKHCIHKYGTCKFYNVCTLPSNQRTAMLASTEFETNDWTPLYK